MHKPSRVRLKKPETYAMRYTGENPYAIRLFTGVFMSKPSGQHFIFTTQNGLDKAELFVNASHWVPIAIGDWVVKDSHEHYRTCTDEIFQKEYEEI